MRIGGESRRGAALVVVLWIAFGLVSMALYFGHSMVMELQKAGNREAGVQAEQAIEGAARCVEHLLASLREAGRLPESDVYPSEAAQVGEAFFWLVARDPGSGETRFPRFGLIDEAGKLNLNTATEDQLLKLPGMTEGLAAAILDWRDSDDEAGENGAESETYLRLDLPYPAKNGRFETEDELRLVAGATPELLYGEDVNRNGILDPGEDDGLVSPPDDDGNGVLKPGLLEYLTVHSIEPNLRTNGEPRIFVGQQNPQGQGGRQELQTLLTDTLGESRAGEVMGRLGNARFPSLLEFYLRSGMTLVEFALVDDSLTTSTNRLLEGLVNVNTAGVEVLATLSDLTYGEAQSLVAFRRSNPGLLNTVGWVADVLSQEKAMALGPLITDKGYRYTADISAVGRFGRGYRRSLMVFDITEGRPRIIHRREMSREGWALGADLREELMAMREERR